MNSAGGVLALHGPGWVRRLSAVSMSLWLAAVTGYYVWTAIGTLRQPFNPGSDVGWAVAAIVFVGVGTVLPAAFPARTLARVGAGGFALLCVAILALSRQLVAALAVAWLLALGWFLGDRTVRWAGAGTPRGFLDSTAVCLPLGMGVLASIGFVLGVFRALTPAGVAICLAALSLLPGISLWRRRRGGREVASAARQFPDRFRIENGFLFSLLVFVFLLGLIWAVAPEIHYDALNYHLAVPRLYIENGGFVDLPYFWHSYFAQSVETLFGLSMALDGQRAAKLLALAFGVILAVQVYSLGRFAFGVRVGLWAAALFASTPLVFWLSSTTYVETAAAMFVTAALLAFLRWREQRRIGWLSATVILMGAAIGAKPTTAFAVPVIVLVLVSDLFRNRSARAATGRLVMAVLGAAALALPWYALRYAFTGNPVFPMLSRLFEGSRWVPEAFTLASLGGNFGLDRSARSLIELPVRFTFETGRFGEALPPGGAGLGLLLLLPLGALLLLLRRSSVSALLAVAASYYVLWVLSSQYARYLVPILPLVIALGVATVATLSPPGRHLHWFLLSLAALAQVFVIPVQFWNIPERIPLKLAFGVESRDAFLRRSLRAYPAVPFLNGVLEPGQKVLGVGADAVRFYLNAPLASPEETWELVPIHSEPDLRRVATELERKGYAYLIDASYAGRRLPFSFLDPGFLTAYATPVFEGSGVQVYRLRPLGPAPPRSMPAPPGGAP